MQKEELKKISVVYVEDEKEVREQISRVLRRHLGEVHSAQNGKEGLEMIKEFNPHVVLTDLEMPVMNGLIMIKKIRETYGEDRPVIVITGYEDEEHYTELADGYIYKPIVINNLFKLIYELAKKYGKI